jgi:hypothetical protein
MMRVMMTKLKLAVNESKTRVAKLPNEKFDFLGYTFGRCFSPKAGLSGYGTVEEARTAHLHVDQYGDWTEQAPAET